MFFQTRLHSDPITYDGLQLKPHWIYRTFGLAGNAVVAFVGPAEVSLENMVDQEDVLRKAPIFSPKMLHFIGEWFVDSLDQGILLQHLFTSELYELLWESGVQGLHKRGNDIYCQNKKATVSIATRSSVSILMHTGINIDTEGTPIPTSGLGPMGLEPVNFAQSLLERFSAQIEGFGRARVKVRGV